MRRITLTCALITCVAAAAQAATRVAITCVNASVCDVNGTLLVRANGTSKSVPVTNGIAHVIDADSEATLNADGYWMPPRRIGDGRLLAWKTAPLRGRFVLADQHTTFPKSFTIAIESPPSR